MRFEIHTSGGSISNALFVAYSCSRMHRVWYVEISLIPFFKNGE
jgi:hypothetical protein